MAAPLPQVRRIENNDEQIGMGFNSESGLAVGTALDGFTVQSDPSAPGQEVCASISIVTSHEELMTKLGMSFEAQGRYGLISGSAKAEFSESSNYNSTSTFLVARCIVRNPFRRGKNFRLTQPAHDLLQALRFDEFRRAFGDGFVRGLQTGGEFYSVIRITSVSSSTQTELAIALQAAFNGLMTAAEFKARLETANASATTRSEFVASMFQRAGDGIQSSPTVEINEVLERYRRFPAIASASAFPYETEVVTYDTLPLPIPRPEEQENFLFALRDAREKKLRYLQTKNDLEFALKNPTLLEAAVTSDVLSSTIAVYIKLINAVMDHAIRLSRGEMDPPRLFDPGALSPPIVEPAPIPVRRVTPAGQIRLPDLVGLDSWWIRSMRGCLFTNSEDDTKVEVCVTQLFPGDLRSPLSRDVVEFLAHTVPPRPFAPALLPTQLLEDRPGMSLTMVADYFSPGHAVIRRQFPPGGTLVARDSDVVLLSQLVP
jgi:hypothetical protein